MNVKVGMAIVAVASTALAACGGSTTKNLKPSDATSHSSVATAPETSSTPPQTTAAPTPTTAPRKNIQIVNYGFTQLAPDSIGSSYVSYGVLLKNANATDAAEDVDVNIALYNAAGAVVKSESETVDLALPNTSVAVADDTVEASGVARMTVQALVGTWESVSNYGHFTVSGVNTVPSDFEGETTTFEVKSSFAKDLKDVNGTALYFDAAGHIIGGAFTFIDFVPAGGSSAGEIDATDTLPVKGTQVFVAPSSLSLL